MAKMFEEGKRYAFSKKLFIDDEVVSKYFNVAHEDRSLWINGMDGKEVKAIDNHSAICEFNGLKHNLHCLWCNELKG